RVSEQPLCRARARRFPPRRPVRTSRAGTMRASIRTAGRGRVRDMTAAMTATVLDGKAVAARVRGEVAEAAAKLRAAGVEPGLAVVLVGEDPASQIYVRNKTTACAQAAIRTFDHRLPANTPEAELLTLVAAL